MKPQDLQNKAIILGVNIDDLPMDFILNNIQDNLRISTENTLKIFTPNPEICLKASQDEEYRNIINSADLNIPDGFGLKFGAKILGEKLVNRVTGTDLSAEILKLCDKNSYRVFILRRPDSLAKPNDISQLFKKKYPNVKFKIGELDKKNYLNCDNILNEINEFEPKILFAALGAPTQEIWINKFIKLLPAVKVAIGVGGAFDFFTGKMKRAPKVMRQVGLEWLYRLYLEPKRLKRIKNATADFFLACHAWKRRMATKMRPNVLGVIRNKYDSKILTQKNSHFRNHWQLPQGGINDNEDLERAIIREIHEELGIEAKLLKIIKQIPDKHAYIWPRYAQLSRGFKGQEQTAFIIEFSGKDRDIHIQNSPEVEAIKWVDKNELLNTVHHHRHEFLKKIIVYL